MTTKCLVRLFDLLLLVKMILKFKLIIILLSVISLCVCELQQQINWSPSIENGTFEKTFLPNFIDFEQDVLQQNDSQIIISDACRDDIRMVLQLLSLRQNSAIQMFNSWSKFPPTGALRGTLTDFGDYDQCVGIEKSFNSSYVNAQYCLIDISVPMPPISKHHNYHQKLSQDVLPNLNQLYQWLESDSSVNQTSIYRHFENEATVFYYVSIRLGFCLPSSCTQNDISTVANKKIHKLGLSVKKLQCETKSEIKLNYVQISAIIVIISMFLLQICAAIYDRYFSVKYDKLNYLFHFSPLRNVRKLCQTKSTNDETELACLHGLRVITIMWIITAHTLEWNGLNIYRDTFLIKDRLSKVLLQVIYKAFYSVETFFYLSGLLTSYVTLKVTHGSLVNFQSLPFILFRYIRLTPQLFIFLLCSSLLPSMFTGPIWQEYMSTLTQTCYKNWWVNLLYLQNVVDIDNICAVHTWFLAADMQLHWLSLIPVVFLLMNRARGILFTKLLIVICVCASGLAIYRNKYPPGHIITSKNDFLDENGMPSDFVSFLYKPWNHASVFFIGFIFGNFLHENKNSKNKFNLKKIPKYLLWLLVMVCYISCIFNTMPYVQGRQYDHWSVLLFPLNRIVWSLMLCLSIWLCVTNNGGALGRMLAWKAFKPLSRMTYPIYLTHAWIIWITLGSRRSLIEQTTYSISLHCMGVIVLSFVVGFVFTILFETPIINIIDGWKIEDKKSGNEDDNELRQSFTIERTMFNSQQTTCN